MSEFLSGDGGLWTLFVTGFLSSTLLPGGSEMSLIAAIRLGDLPLWQLVLVATLGNTLGGLTNYVLGRFLPDKDWANHTHIHRALHWARRYGVVSLLLSWLPIIGDPLCLVAGWLRLNFWWSTIAICVGKALRYAALAIIVT